MLVFSFNFRSRQWNDELLEDVVEEGRGAGVDVFELLFALGIGEIASSSGEA